MIPGPDFIIVCPHCKGLAKYMTLMSGNTYGARSWTDGKKIAPMLPHPPTVVKCRHCPECYWLGDAEVIGSISEWNNKDYTENPAWAFSEYIEEPSEEEYYRAIETNLARNKEQERQLRILAWWRSNDNYRDTGQTNIEGEDPLSIQNKENLEILADLIGEAGDNERIMKSEILRELGEFDKAIKVLSRVTSHEYSSVIDQLQSLCESKDTCVRKLQI